MIDRFPCKGEDRKEWIENRRFTIKQLMQSDTLRDNVYKDLLERLGIKIVRMEKVLQNIDLRIETEFYQVKRANFCNVKGAAMGAFSQYRTSRGLNEDRQGHPVLRLNEFDSFFIHAPAKYCNLIAERTYQTLKLKRNDVLICRTNGNPEYVGKAALVPQDYDCAFASYLYRIRPDIEIINPTTLVAYLNCAYGRAEIKRLSIAGNQAGPYTLPAGTLAST